MKREDLISAGKALCIIGAFYLILQLAGITCPIKYLTGVSCMGCGMTRVVLSAIRLDLAADFHYHPLFPVVPVAAVVILLRDKIKYYNIIISIFILAFLAVYGYRMFFVETEIVTFAPSSGAVASLLNKIPIKLGGYNL